MSLGVVLTWVAGVAYLVLLVAISLTARSLD